MQPAQFKNEVHSIGDQVNLLSTYIEHIRVVDPSMALHLLVPWVSPCLVPKSPQDLGDCVRSRKEGSTCPSHDHGLPSWCLLSSRREQEPKSILHQVQLMMALTALTIVLEDITAFPTIPFPYDTI